MGDLTPRGHQLGAGNSKLRRKQLDVMSLDVGMEQRRIEIMEKEEELERMAAQRVKLLEDIATLERQFTTNTHQA